MTNEERLELEDEVMFQRTQAAFEVYSEAVRVGEGVDGAVKAVTEAMERNNGILEGRRKGGG